MRTDQRHYHPNTFMGRTERNKRRALERANNKKNFYRKEEAAIIKEIAPLMSIHEKTPLGIENKRKLGIDIPVEESFYVLLAIISFILIFVTLKS